MLSYEYKFRDNSLVVNKRGVAHWSDVPSTRMNVTKGKLLHYLIDILSIGNRVLRQQVGILMGRDCAPLLAHLFLFYYEHRFMNSLIT